MKDRHIIDYNMRARGVSGFPIAQEASKRAGKKKRKAKKHNPLLFCVTWK